ncbi:MAG: sulfatase [Bacteroidales bacterium]|nr:sulfatase [Bacteroidales bacterium]
MKSTISKLLVLTLFIGLFHNSFAKKNVLFIAIDDLKPLLNCYGYDIAKTPNIDKLASQGTLFINAYCQQALCGPSRLSIMTGRYPDVLGIYGMGGAQTKLRKRYPDIVTLPQYFIQNGYKTAYRGKLYDSRNFDDGNTDKASWNDTELVKPMPYPKPWGKPEGGYQDPDTKKNSKQAWDLVRKQGLTNNRPKRNPILKSHKARPVVECMDVPDNAYNDGRTALWGVQQLKANAAKADSDPFFLAIGFSKPHLPFVAPKKYWDMYNRESMPVPSYKYDPKNISSISHNDYVEGRVYYGVPGEGDISDEKHQELMHGYLACVSYIDAQIGMLLSTLKETGLDKNTIVIMWGDHGFHTGDHGIWGKHSNWEQSVRAPLIISSPELKSNVSHSLVEFVDIYPTTCDLAGLDIPSALDGKSLAPVMKNPATQLREYAASLYPRAKEEKPYMGFTIRDERYRYIAWYPVKNESEVGYEIIAEPIAYELYDYEADYNETENLSGKSEYKDVEKKMHQLIKEHIDYTQNNKLSKGK